MLKNVSRTKIAGTWVAAIIVLMACSVVVGADMTIGTAELWFVACVVPPGLLLLLWRGAPPLTVAELLHAVDTEAKDGRA
jgi:hypothetical protein